MSILTHLLLKHWLVVLLKINKRFLIVVKRDLQMVVILETLPERFCKIIFTQEQNLECSIEKYYKDFKTINQFR